MPFFNFEHLIGDAADLVNVPLDLVDDHRQQHLDASMHCVEDHARQDAAEAARDDIEAGRYNVVPDAARIRQLDQFDAAVADCDVPETIDHVPHVPITASPVLAAAYTVLWPSEIHEPGEGHALAADHYAKAFGPEYHQQGLQAFDQALDARLAIDPGGGSGHPHDAVSFGGADSGGPGDSGGHADTGGSSGGSSSSDSSSSSGSSDTGAN